VLVQLAAEQRQGKERSRSKQFERVGTSGKKVRGGRRKKRTAKQKQKKWGV
jgi:hypothetical protein